MVHMWKEELKKEERREFEGLEWQITNVKHEKDRIKGLIQIGEGPALQRCGISFF